MVMKVVSCKSSFCFGTQGEAYANGCLCASVHDDVQLCQWLRSRDGKIKLGDFNRAEVMDFDPEKQQYCKYNNGECYGNVSFAVSSMFVSYLATQT